MSSVNLSHVPLPLACRSRKRAVPSVLCELLQRGHGRWEEVYCERKDRDSEVVDLLKRQVEGLKASRSKVMTDMTIDVSERR